MTTKIIANLCWSAKEIFCGYQLNIALVLQYMSIKKQWTTKKSFPLYLKLRKWTWWQETRNNKVAIFSTLFCEIIFQTKNFNVSYVWNYERLCLKMEIVVVTWLNWQIACSGSRIPCELGRLVQKGCLSSCSDIFTNIPCDFTNEMVISAYCVGDIFVFVEKVIHC